MHVYYGTHRSRDEVAAESTTVHTMGGMDLEAHKPRQIGEEEIHDAAPKVRALVLERLEMIWGQVQPYVDGTIAREDGRIDVRFLEAGIRVCDRLSRLYRLDSPAASKENVDVLIDSRALVMAQLAEISARMTPEG